MNTSSRRTLRRRASIFVSSLILVLGSVALLDLANVVNADQAANDGDNAEAKDYDDKYYQDVGNGDDYSAWNGYDDKYSKKNYGNVIKYWTDYAIYPKRCINYNGADVVVFSIYDNHAKQCTNDPVGTYYEPVPTFLAGYMKQLYQDSTIQGIDYEEPDVLQYAYCTGFYINQVMYYLQAGCADNTTQSLVINIYTDDACTIRATNDDGEETTNFDTSDIQIGFKKCQNCVNWFDMSVEVDDGFYEKHMTDAPMCSTAWESKKTCDRKCQRIGVEKSRAGEQGWNASDNMLLMILITFGIILVGLIIRKRNKMSNKDALLEQAAMSAAGLQQPHIIGIFALVIVVIAVFALLGLKNITWALLLILNTALFGYLMKLTVDASANETIIGPDGTVLRHDDSDDDSSMDDPPTSNNTSNLFVPPAIAESTISNVASGETTPAMIENRASATNYVLPTLD